MTCLRLECCDLEAVLDAAEHLDAITDDGSEDAVRRLLDALARLVPCDVASWNWISLRSGFQELALVHAPSGRTQERARVGPWLAHLPEHPVMSRSFGPVVAISDVLSPRKFDNSWLYQEAFRPDGLRHEIGMHLSHGPSEINTVTLSRGPGPDFSPRDHLVLRLLRPHVDAAVQRLTRPPPKLTARQLEVLGLVREGFTDAQVARRLGIAEPTVGKHLQHVYARTGARSRLQAVAVLPSLLEQEAPTPR